MLVVTKQLFSLNSFDFKSSLLACLGDVSNQLLLHLFCLMFQFSHCEGVEWFWGWWVIVCFAGDVITPWMVVLSNQLLDITISNLWYLRQILQVNPIILLLFQRVIFTNLFNNFQFLSSRIVSEWFAFSKEATLSSCSLLNLNLSKLILTCSTFS